MSRKEIIVVIVVASIVSILLMAAIIPRFVPPRDVAARESCIAVLKQIDSAMQMWEMEHSKATNEVPVWLEQRNGKGKVLTWDDLSRYLKRAPLTCPDGGSYSLGSAADGPQCSIPIHSLHFGSVLITDAAGVAIPDVMITVYRHGKLESQQQTDSTGYGNVASFPASMVDDWVDGSRKIVVSKEGYREDSSPVTVKWPIHFKLQKKVD